MEFYHNSGYYFHFRPIVPTRFCIDHVWKLRLVRPSSYCVSDFNNYLRSSLKRRLLCPCHISNSFFFFSRENTDPWTPIKPLSLKLMVVCDILQIPLYPLFSFLITVYQFWLLPIVCPVMMGD